MTLDDQTVLKVYDHLCRVNGTWQPIGPNDIREILTAALPFLTGVTVKKLEWVKHAESYHESALTEFGALYIATQEGWRIDGRWFDVAGIEAAKAAAQADYEARFWSMAEVSAPDMGNPITLVYTNYRGETSERTITPIKPWFGSTEWHPEPQWLLTAFDHEKQTNRDFALKDFGYPAPSPRAQALEEKPAAYLRQKDIDRLSSCHPGAINVQIANTSFMSFTVPVFAALSQPVSPDVGVERPVEGGCKTLDDGRPCSMDEFMSALFNEKVDEFDVSEAAASWVNGNWKEALSYLSDVPPHWRPLPQAPGVAV